MISEFLIVDDNNEVVAAGNGKDEAIEFLEMFRSLGKGAYRLIQNKKEDGYARINTN